MYAFVTLFGLLAAVDPAAGDPQPQHGQLGGVHPRHRGAAVVALLRPAADRRAAADLGRRADPQTARRASRSGPLRTRLRLLARRAGDAARAAARVRAQAVRLDRRRALGSPERAPTTRCPSTPSSPTWPGRSGATTPTASPSCSPRRWPLLLLLSLLLLGRGGSRQTMHPRGRRDHADRAPDRRGAVRPRAVRGALLPRRGAAAVPADRPARHRLDTTPRGAHRRRRRSSCSRCCSGLADQQTNDDNPRLYDFRGALEEIKDRRRAEEPRALRAARHALRAGVLRARAAQPAAAPGRAQAQGGKPGLRARLLPGQQALLRPDQQGGRQARLPPPAAARSSRRRRRRCWEFR